MLDNTKNNAPSWGQAISKVSFLLLTVFLLVTVIYLLRNVLHAIVLAAFFAVILSPINRRLQSVVRRLLLWRIKFKRKRPLSVLQIRNYENRARWISSLLMVLLVFCFITVPVTFLVINVARQGSRTIPSAEKWVRKEIPRKMEEFRTKYGSKRYVVKLAELLGELELLNKEGHGDEKNMDDNVSEETLPEDYDEIAKSKGTPDDMLNLLGERLVDMLRSVLRKIWQGSLKVLSRTWLTIFNFFIMLFVMFHFFHDGEAIWNYLKSISPLGDEEQQRVTTRIREISRAVSFSIFGTALVQGLLAMIFFRIVGIPALFWGFMLGICSIIPIVGTGLIWVPATIYLYMTGQVWQAVFILISCGCITANIDSLMRPFLMKQGGNTGMSYLVLFFSVLGGLQTFGLVGVIYGPLIMGICGICLLIFSTQFKARANAANESTGVQQ